jgi:hypothetical protein
MKLSAEVKVWVKQEENRIKSCIERKKGFQRQKILLDKAIALEDQQIALIESGIAEVKERWGKA